MRLIYDELNKAQPTQPSEPLNSEVRKMVRIRNLSRKIMFHGENHHRKFAKKKEKRKEKPVKKSLRLFSHSDMAQEINIKKSHDGKA